MKPTFSRLFDPASVESSVRRSERCTGDDVRRALADGCAPERRALALFSPAAADMLEPLAQAAHRATVERFGNTIALFAPLYLSNECVCTCTYCGFSRGLDIRRRTLRIDEVIREARLLARHGFRNLLLVSAEHPKHTSVPYLAQCVRETKRLAPYVALEVAAAPSEAYEQYCAAGADGVVLYQETYEPNVYASHHLAGPKKKFAWRLDAPQRAAEAGIRHLGIGALLGLSDWRYEAFSLLAHLRFLERYCWRAQVNLSFPRINAAEGGYTPRRPVSDAVLSQLICAFRLLAPTTGIVVSTREQPALREGLAALGVTHMSAGSSTEPGGYGEPGLAGEQFHLEDRRSAEEVADRLRRLGYDPVFKDWDHMRDLDRPVAMARSSA